MGRIDKLVEKKAKEILRIRRIIFILKFIEESKNITQECKEFEISKTTYYKWKNRYNEGGKEALYRKKPIARSHPNQLTKKTVEKILELRKTYQLGPKRIMWYLERYHGIKVSESSVSRTLVRNGMNRLSKSVSRRTVHTRRYAKEVPGHRVQMDVKFANLTTVKGKNIKRYQYTAIDDATRIRALKMVLSHL